MEEPRSLTILREACLRRGASGIKGIGRTFRIYDDNGSKRLDLDEFRNGMRDYGVTELSDVDMEQLFQHFDQDGNGQLSFDEFLQALRPPMSRARTDLIQKAFQKLDKSGDGVVTADDLKQTYSVDKHPKYKTGEWTRTQVLQEFLNNFQLGPKDDVVTYEEFLNYYAGVSASIDKDIYFDFMMRQNWKL